MLSQRIFKIGFSILAFWLMSCINTSYSRYDEVEITSNELDLILGQFAHHGESFYQHEVVRTKALLLEDEGDFVARNDLATAYIKLEQNDKAEEEFNKNEVMHPGKYETAANRGVLYKKMGKYELAAGYLEDSLRIKEGGHMGLGDYYLKMIQWLDVIQKNPDYSHNFLGAHYYHESFSDEAKVANQKVIANKEYLITLIKNDFHFPDVYLVLGDIYLEEQQYQLALRCYYRARYLKHPADFVLSERLRVIGDELKKLKKDDQIVEPSYSVEEQVFGEIQAAELWLKSYKEIEKSMIQHGKSVDFKSMKEELKLRGLTKPKVLDAMLYKGEVIHESGLKVNFGDPRVIITGAVLIMSLVLPIWWRFKSK